MANSLSRDDNDITVAEREARADAAWLAAHGYETSVHVYSTALTCYGPESSRTTYAAGYAVRYAGQLVRDDGSRAEYPTEGITVYCQDGQLPLGRLLAHGRALVSFGTGGWDYGSFEPYYVAAWNPRESEVQRDQAVNPGVLKHVHMHRLTPLIGGDGPLRFYDLRLMPAGDLATGTRVRVIAHGDPRTGDFRGQAGVIRHPHHATPMVELDPQPDPLAGGITRKWGQLRQFRRDELALESDAGAAPYTETDHAIADMEHDGGSLYCAGA
jgi:hypothetical protein